MRKDYVVVGKFSEISLEDALNKEIEKSISSIIPKEKVSRMLLKTLISVGLVIVFSTAFQDITFAADVKHLQPGTGYKEPTKLNAILAYIDWLIFMTRWIVSAIIGLITTYAGYKWSTDISGSGSAEAKKILLNCGKGLFWVQFGATIANYFVDKMQEFL